MMLVRYGQAAMIAAIMTLTGNAVWAQSTVGGLHSLCGNTGGCCKDGKCCKDGEHCCKSKKCEACGKDKASHTKTGHGCCPFLSKLAKRTAIIMVMPASMPLPVGCCMEAMEMMPHPPLPPLPPGPHVFLPPMPPPIPAPQAEPVFAYGYDAGGLKCIPPVCAPPPVVSCGITAPAAAAKVRITATASGDQLEMSVGEETSIRCKCKKMTITIGDNEITVSRFDDRVRVRGEELKATASSVRTEGKDRLILEGDVVLHYKKDGHSANLIGERIELNLSNSAMTIQRTAKAPSSPIVDYSGIGR